jgi:hypothetical protein
VRQVRLRGFHAEYLIKVGGTGSAMEASLGRWELGSVNQGERRPALHKVGAGGRRSLAPAGGWPNGDYGGAKAEFF